MAWTLVLVLALLVFTPRPAAATALTWLAPERYRDPACSCILTQSEAEHKYGVFDVVGAPAPPAPPAPPIIPSPPPATVPSMQSCGAIDAVVSTSLAAIGDSRTAGSAPAFASWLAYLSAYRPQCHPAITYANFGVNGDTTTMMVSRFDAVLASGAQIIAIQGDGWNDLVAGIPVATIVANVRHMAQRAVAAGRVAIILGPIPGGHAPFMATLTTLRALVYGVAVDENAYHADMYAVLDDGTGTILSAMRSSGPHQNDKGSQAIARQVARSIGWMVVGD